MRRRELLGSFAAVAASRPLVAFAKDSTRRPVVAVLIGAPSTTSSRYVNGFSQGLQELGYSEGRNIDIVYRYADGDLARLPGLAGELIALRPDAIVSGTTAGILAVKQATATIPIVGPGMTDPEGFGLIASIARPGAKCGPSDRHIAHLGHLTRQAAAARPRSAAWRLQDRAAVKCQQLNACFLPAEC